MADRNNTRAVKDLGQDIADQERASMHPACSGRCTIYSGRRCAGSRCDEVLRQLLVLRPQLSLACAANLGLWWTKIGPLPLLGKDQQLRQALIHREDATKVPSWQGNTCWWRSLCMRPCAVNWRSAIAVTKSDGSATSSMHAYGKTTDQAS